MALLRSMEVPAGLAPILLPGERLVTAVRAHWAKLAEPVVTATLALAAAVWVDSNVTKSTQAVGTIFWWIFFALLVRLRWRLLDWSHNWFVATDKRLLLRYGLISHKVAMMPLLKVTDMSYVRSIPGQFFHIVPPRRADDREEIVGDLPDEPRRPGGRTATARPAAPGGSTAYP